MSRVGHLPVEIPEKIEVTVEDNVVTIKGPKGELSQEINEHLDISLEDNTITINRSTNSRDDKCVHGLSRSLVINMIEGVINGFEKKLELNGVGYRVQKQGSNLELKVGYSHPVVIEPAEGIELNVEGNDKIIVSGIDKQKVGETAANIRAVRPPEPYNGKGIKYIDEHISRKEGKTG
ncbi:50S ribosomal protein L6 [Selenihalanaerobacter shriftii]|uniref:Large ribosomal subunit protein uL6 n=1 Tax=Selenihalanaerobacter shriftii TaxID=142842 RepID=A0A1T4Q4R2_9FIRM|nr:50S ribosomal protein L6 [Selenihalanaerobacter shriftii]SJZ98729.1 large subunit ribosomal protein L6 [Selenihalanaerobacter shriftii]